MLTPRCLRVCASITCWCLGTISAADHPIQLRDVTAQTGIEFQHFDGSGGDYYVVETMSAGLALFDYDMDGDVDIYFLNGAPMRGTDVDVPPTNVLYRNDGNWRFTDVTREAGVGDLGHGLGVTVGDYDNDGDPDLYLNNFGPNVLYRNDGDGTFTDVTTKAGVGNGDRVGAGTSFLDIDADGDLDLYVANYVKFTFDNHVPRTKQGYPIYGGPGDYQRDPDTLLRNNGDGTFTDVSESSGIAAHAGPGMGLLAADYDNDGDADVFVANDGTPDFLFENDGSGKFTEVGLLRGFAFDGAGKVRASMGVDAADYNNDGFLDFHVTSFQGELATLYKNVEGVLLEDVTNVTSAGVGTLQPVTWGNGFADFDNDGDRDLFIACGHLYDQLHHFDRSTTYHTPNVLLENLGGGKFANVTSQCGQGMATAICSRGAGFDDLDNDGDIDVVVLNSRREPTILNNESPAQNHWITLRLRGTNSSRDAVGARVQVVTDELTQMDEVRSGRGYQGHHGSRLHFGLGRHTRVDEIRVQWMGGGVDRIRDVSADQEITITETGGDGTE